MSTTPTSNTSLWLPMIEGQQSPTHRQPRNQSGQQHHEVPTKRHRLDERERHHSQHHSNRLASILGHEPDKSCFIATAPTVANATDATPRQGQGLASNHEPSSPSR